MNLQQLYSDKNSGTGDSKHFLSQLLWTTAFEQKNTYWLFAINSNKKDTKEIANMNTTCVVCIICVEKIWLQTEVYYLIEVLVTTTIKREGTC